MAANRLRLSSIPPIGGMGLGVLAAASVALSPAGLFELAVGASGIAALVPAAQPPLGSTARLLFAGAAGLFTSATAWAALYLVLGPGGAFAREGGEDGLPTVRRADAHPDAPPRRLLSAAELGAPPPPIERALPTDLERPLAAFDPAAMRLEPMTPGRPVPPLAIKPAPLSPGERIASVELPARDLDEAGAPTIESLLARLEQGARTGHRHRRVA